jgi:hypothetical protein
MFSWYENVGFNLIKRENYDRKIGNLMRGKKKRRDLKSK